MRATPGTAARACWHHNRSFAARFLITTLLQSSTVLHFAAAVYGLGEHNTDSCTSTDSKRLYGRTVDTEVCAPPPPCRRHHLLQPCGGGFIAAAVFNPRLPASIKFCLTGSCRLSARPLPAPTDLPLRALLPTRTSRLDAITRSLLTVLGNTYGNKGCIRGIQIPYRIRRATTWQHQFAPNCRQMNCAAPTATLSRAPRAPARAPVARPSSALPKSAPGLLKASG